MRGRRAGLFVVALVALAAMFAPAATAAPSWRLEQPQLPGSPLLVPLGSPGDLQFFTPNRGLLMVGGNGSVPKGLLYWNGIEWRQLATVCGGRADKARVAWAGPNEFWTVSDPSADQPSPQEDDFGATLCRFRDGALIASYAVPKESNDPYFSMNSASCRGPDSCWFGGAQQARPDGSQRGAFHLHWDGSSLKTIYGPQGRAVSDIEAHGDGLFESVFVGPKERDTNEPDLTDPEPAPFLLHRLSGSLIENDSFLPALPGAQTELLGLDSDGSQLWAVGGEARSGPSPESGRPPIAVRLAGDQFAEVPIAGGSFASSDRFLDVAAVPGTDTAWVVVARESESSGEPQAPARVAHLDADGSVLDSVMLPETGAPRGTAAKIACPSSSECWLATSTGWLLHYTDGGLTPDSNFLFSGTISTRPPDGRSPQPQPDANPVDDSLKNAQPPLDVQPVQTPTDAKQLRPLLRRVRSKLIGRRTLVVSFTLTRVARVGLTARRKGKVVARVRPRKLKPGSHALRLKLDPRHWPTSMRFRTVELDPAAQGPAGGGSDPDSVST